MKFLIKTVVSSLLCCSLNAMAANLDNIPVVCGHEMQSQDEAIYGLLNYGLYWFGDQKTDQVQTSVCAADQSVFFDPTKQHTMIFVHGFSPNSVQKNTRFNFNANDIAGPKVNDLVAPWLNGTSGDRHPWNVGVFYWNQFADEESVHPLDPRSDLQATQAAEAKIWKINGPDQMRWRDNQGVEHNADGIDQDMAHIFARNYIQELKEYAKQNPKADIRLVGESLGSQLVIHGARLIADQVDAAGSGLPENLIPKQVVVLDPVVTKDGSDETRLSSLIDDIKALKTKGVIFSGYRTSNIGMSSALSDNTALLKNMAFSEDKPSECIYHGVFQLKNQHTFGIWWYLLSYNLAAVPVSGESATVSAPYANLPDSDLKMLMDSPIKFVSHYANQPGQGECDPNNIDAEWAGWQMKSVNKSDPR